MNCYLKIEGSGGGASGSGISFIEVYDQSGAILGLTKSDVVETNAAFRIDEINYVQMFQTRGALIPYNGNASGIYYVIKLPEHVVGFTKVYLKNWGNGSYDIRNIRVSVSNDNLDYKEIYYGEFGTSEEKYILQNYFLNKRRLLVQSKDRIYSLIYSDSFEPLAMTSYTTPSPYEITSSGDYSTSYACWKAFDGKNATYSDSWITTSGAPLGWIQVNFGTSKVYNQLSFTTRNHTDSNTTAPKEFKILGSFDGVSWTELALIQNQTGWKQNETRIFEFNNLRAYQYYRLQITVANSTSYSAIGELVFGYKDLSLINLNNKSDRSFIDYGQVEKLEGLNLPISIVCYVIQDIKERDTTIKQIDKKPLSISFN
ncbi:discoidin domain-containing protein [Lysinibacillus sphaericus]|uniref:discoidin domain-containing protein n=1 Tax=Lysinibacillus sphaericus TaxID=1421 RepID=UPI0038021449